MIGRRDRGSEINVSGRLAGQSETAYRTRLFYLIMALVLGGLLLASKPVEPSRLPNVCLPDILFGVPCITTGLTRGFHAVSLGQLDTALAYHPLSPFLYGIVIAHLLLACLRLVGWRARLIPISNRVQVMVWGTIGLLFVFWIPRVLAMVLAR
ncbi:MAG: DUF2752 domain-containing protein [Anaerolineae bacterium]|jgi:hypothetical protein